MLTQKLLKGWRKKISSQIEKFNKLAAQHTWYTSKGETVIKAYPLRKHKGIIILKVLKNGVNVYYTLDEQGFTRFYKFYVLKDDSVIKRKT